MKNSNALEAAKSLKLRWMELPAEFFECLTFRDLKEGDKFIDLPLPGDNDGHGGFKSVECLFVKVVKRIGMPSRPRDRYMAVRLIDGVLVSPNHFGAVVKVL
jgi:hypothetical protein